MADLPDSEECGEMQAQLTRVASERVALERCANRAKAKAADLFVTGRDTDARLMRDMAQEFDGWAKDASERQQTILKQLHPEIYK